MMVFSENETIWESPVTVLSVRDDTRMADSRDMRYRENSRLTLCCIPLVKNVICQQIKWKNQKSKKSNIEKNLVEPFELGGPFPEAEQRTHRQTWNNAKNLHNPYRGFWNFTQDMQQNIMVILKPKCSCWLWIKLYIPVCVHKSMWS